MIRIGPALPCALLLLLPAAPSLAAHKCIVNGQTVYQQTPCANDQGQEIRLQPNSVGGGGGGTSYTASQSAKARQEIEGKGWRLASEAYERLSSGRIDVYVANLCPRERTQWNNPSLKGSLAALGKVLASDNLRPAGPTDVTETWLSFVVRPEFKGGDTSIKPRQRTVRAHFGREMGELCLRVLDVGA